MRYLCRGDFNLEEGKRKVKSTNKCRGSAVKNCGGTRRKTVLRVKYLARKKKVETSFQKMYFMIADFFFRYILNNTSVYLLQYVQIPSLDEGSLAATSSEKREKLKSEKVQYIG